ncbi:MAG: M48 family metalloprotease [Patescibacteria group bacterium]|nr:M48 family metalloprotease [Patescibacteria group bacterium]
MIKNLKFASLVTLGILSGFVFTILASAAYLLGSINAPFLIGATIVFNFLMWIIGPMITDFMMRFFYKIKFYSIEDIHSLYPETASFLKTICQKNNVKSPKKIGIIDDDNPTAFTYGSLPSNARLVFTKGLFTYLEKDEVEAVLAHEIGHIVHYDFVIMTIASTLLQILYELYVIFTKSKQIRRNKKGQVLVYIGLLSYVFYFIGSYVILYLSRVREYYADEFAAKNISDPNKLSTALIKIAYGIVAKEDDKKSGRLMESTRALGILDVKSAKGLGLALKSSDTNETINKTMAFDFVSPWAFVLELGSTHPLTGKRIERLGEVAKSIGKENMFNIRAAINNMTIDKEKLYHGFLLGVFVFFLPHFAILFGLSAVLLTGGSMKILFIFLGLAFIIKALYMFPNNIAEKTTIREQMADIYNSPIRGKRILLDGKIIGRGQAGAALSEDLMFQDNGGLVFLDYNSKLGKLGDFFFALTKINKLIGQQVIAQGWFFRGIGQKVSLSYLELENKKIKSHPKLWAIIVGVVLIFLGI